MYDKNSNTEEYLSKLRKSVFTSDFEKSYSSIEKYVEIFDKSDGINNYANEILNNLNNLNNESHTWKSGLDIEKFSTELFKDSTSSNSTSRENTFKISDELRQKAFKFNFQPIKIVKTSHENIISPTCDIKNMKESPPNNSGFTFKKIANNNENSVTSGKLSCGSLDELKIVNEPVNRFNRPNVSYERRFENNQLKPDTCVKENYYGFPKSSKVNSETEANKLSVNRDNNEFPFKTASEQLNIDLRKKNSNNSPQVNTMYGSNKKSLGTRRGVRSEYVNPYLSNRSDSCVNNEYSPSTNTNSNILKPLINNKYESILSHESLKQFEPGKVETLLNEIMDLERPIAWDDIAGLESAKEIIQEIIILPMLRPDIFTGIRAPAKGLLLFGPPGTGKTLIGKCVASQSQSTFFSISASSLTSKWVGDGEKMVRIMFTVARLLQPSVIFIDEIDSLLSQRNESEHESSRKIKTEFLIQMDGISTFKDEKLLLIGATNRPYEIDEAARRRFVKRVYIPLPSPEARSSIILNNIKDGICITEQELKSIVEKSDGYSGADMYQLCVEAAMGSVRRLPRELITNMPIVDVPQIRYHDFLDALTNVKPSVSVEDLDKYIKWNEIFGTSLRKT